MKLLTISILLIVILSISGLYLDTHILYMDGKYVVIVVKESSGKSLSNFMVRILVNKSKLPELKELDLKTLYIVDENGVPLYFNATRISEDTLELLIRIPKLSAYSIKKLYLYYGGSNPYKGYALPREAFFYEYKAFSDSFDTKSSRWNWTPYWTVARGLAIYTSDREAGRFPKPPESLISKRFEALCSSMCKIVARAKSEGRWAYDMRISWFTGRYWVTVSFIMWSTRKIGIEIKAYTDRGSEVNPDIALSIDRVYGIDMRNWNTFSIEFTYKKIRICIDNECRDGVVYNMDKIERIVSIALGSKGRSLWDYVEVHTLKPKYLDASSMVKIYVYSYEEYQTMVSLASGVDVEKILKELSQIVINNVTKFINSELSKLRREIEDINKRLSLTESRVRSLEYLKDRVSALSQRLTKIQNDLASLSRSLFMLEDRVDSLSSRLSDYTSIRRDVDSLREELSALRSTVSWLREKVETLSSDLDQLAQTLNEVVDNVTNYITVHLSEEVSKALRNVEVLASQVEMKLSSISINMSSIEHGLKNEISRLRTEVVDKLTYIERKVAKAFKDIDTQSKELEKSKKYLEARIEDLSQSLEDLSMRIDNLSSRLQELETSFSESSGSIVVMCLCIVLALIGIALGGLAFIRARPAST